MEYLVIYVDAAIAIADIKNDIVKYHESEIVYHI